MRNQAMELQYHPEDGNIKSALQENQQISKTRCTDRISKRFIFSLVGFMGSTLTLALTVNLNMAIVYMVDRTNDTLLQVKSSNECLSNNPSMEFESVLQEPSIQKPRGEFQWDPQTEGFILASVYFGQLLSVFPGGRAAELYGGKRTLVASLSFASICTIALPLTARLSVYAFILCRFLVGVGTGPMIPVLFHLIIRWIPESERSFNASFIMAGLGMGTCVSFFTSGVLCGSDFLGGWPAVFYVGGVCGFLWCLLCCLFVYETPKDHPTITSTELAYISKNLGVIEHKKVKTIPWTSLLSSVPFWSLAVGYFGQFWIIAFFCTVQSLYMGTILNLDSVTNAEFSCLPHFARAVFACICGCPLDWALKKGYVRKGFVRKGATLINSLFACTGFMAITLVGCSTVLNTIFFTVGELMGDFVCFGVCMAAMDIAPNLFGTITGILRFIAIIPFIVIPELVGLATKYERSMAQWRYIYYGSIGVVLSTTIVYLLFGTSEPQAWGTGTDDAPKSTDESKKENGR